jgi:hypothetical protein
MFCWHKATLLLQCVHSRIFGWYFNLHRIKKLWITFVYIRVKYSSFPWKIHKIKFPSRWNVTIQSILMYINQNHLGKFFVSLQFSMSSRVHYEHPIKFIKDEIKFKLLASEFHSKPSFHFLHSQIEVQN